MVLMTVGYDKTLYPIGIFDHIAEIRDDYVDAGHFVIGEGHPAVDNKHIVAVFVNRHVFADFVKTAQRNDLKRRSLFASTEILKRCPWAFLRPAEKF